MSGICTRKEAGTATPTDILIRRIVVNENVKGTWQGFENVLKNMTLSYDGNELNKFLKGVKVHIHYRDHLSMDFNSLKTAELYPKLDPQLSNQFDQYMDNTTRHGTIALVRGYTFHQVDSIILSVHGQNVIFRCVHKMIEAFLVDNPIPDMSIPSVAIQHFLDILYKFIVLCQCKTTQPNLTQRSPNDPIVEEFIKHVLYLKEVGDFLDTQSNTHAQPPSDEDDISLLFSKVMGLNDVNLQMKEAQREQMMSFKEFVKYTVLMHDRAQEMLQQAITNKNLKRTQPQVRPQQASTSASDGTIMSEVVKKTKKEIEEKAKKTKKEIEAAKAAKAVQVAKNAKAKAVSDREARAQAREQARVQAMEMRKTMQDTPTAMAVNSQSSRAKNAPAQANAVQKQASMENAAVCKISGDAKRLDADMNSEMIVKVAVQSEITQVQATMSQASSSTPQQLQQSSSTAPEPTQMQLEPTKQLKGYMNHLRNKMANLMAILGDIRKNLERVYPVPGVGQLSDEPLTSDTINNIFKRIVFLPVNPVNTTVILPDLTTVPHELKIEYYMLEEEYNHKLNSFIEQKKQLAKEASHRLQKYYESEMNKVSARQNQDAITRRSKVSAISAANERLPFIQRRLLSMPGVPCLAPTIHKKEKNANIAHAKRHFQLLQKEYCNHEIPIPLNRCDLQQKTEVLHHLMANPDVHQTPSPTVTLSCPDVDDDGNVIMQDIKGGRRKSNPKPKPKRSVSPPRLSKSRRPTRRGS